MKKFMLPFFLRGCKEGSPPSVGCRERSGNVSTSIAEVAACVFYDKTNVKFDSVWGPVRRRAHVGSLLLLS